MKDRGEDEIVLRLLHTADWHLGRRFPRFGEEDQRKLMHARIAVVERVLGEAQSKNVDAVLCAGDLFDEPMPERTWWEELAKLFGKLSWQNRPVFLLPGNHDPLLPDSIWRKEQFRRMLPGFVHIVDREYFEVPLGEHAVLYAVPCMSRAGQNDPTLKIPQRAEGDTRIRIGMVHGSTFDAVHCETDFPIHQDAAVNRGLDYLAIGDTHGFRFVPPNRLRPPTIYPGAPEPTAFDEKDPGNVAVVMMTRQREAKVVKQPVAFWKWEEAHVSTLAELRALAGRSDLQSRVLRLRVEMRLPAAEFEEAEALIEELTGTPAKHAKVGVLELDKTKLSFDPRSLQEVSKNLPATLQATLTRLQTATESEDERERELASRALYHLFCLLRKAS
jgi:DNA repair exonuclease SbcCD nuclease subunit